MGEHLSSQEEKLALLAEQWGMTEDEFVRAYALDSVNTRHRVTSALVLAGMI